MTFEDAIAAHIKWKVRVSQFIDGTGTEPFTSECGLSRWIYGEGARFNGHPHYKGLVTKNANFHRCAADVVKKVEARDRAGARALFLNSLSMASKDTIATIMDLKKAMAKSLQQA
ncbi:MAG: CZB domain-containing protein [Sulfuricella sp.]|nr:CZB domain-containing protein [Sulfuricella sp.]